MIGAAVLTIALALAPSGATAAGGNGKLKLESLSSRADLVTGGDALVAVEVPKGIDPRDVTVRRDGLGVTGSFAPAAGEPRRLVGVVDGLRSGANLITASAPGSNRPATLSLFNSSAAGPLISGPHQEPFYCTTEKGGLGSATDEDCFAPTKVEYRYRSTNGGFKRLADPTDRPTDLARTTTRDGRTVDYVVRVESGVINRAVYRWSVLAPGGRLGDGWNRRLLYRFGGGCGAGHQQGTSGVGMVLDNRNLSQGYSMMSSSLTVLGTACNDVLSAETVAMVKEHVIESLGEPPAWTIGQGGSGGSVQAQLISQNYPGLLDGIIPGASFPDASAPDYPDCRLLNNYFDSTGGSGLTDAERSAITGMVHPDGCLALGAGADVVNASEGCNESIVPPAVIFDAQTNPDGVRCTSFESMVNIYGTDPDTGYARSPLDNVGIQYGLRALKQGRITKREFLDLNDEIGGYDVNGEIRQARTVGNPQALAIAYRSGRINQGAGNIPNVPIIDVRKYQDAEINPHQYVNTYRFRARLQRTNGTYGNQVMFRAIGRQNVQLMHDEALDLMGSWLDRIAADDSSRPLRRKVLANRPPAAADACWIDGERVNGPAVIGAQNRCQTTYAPHSLPVNVAGHPLDSLVAKCRLRPVDPAEYGTLSANQRARLAVIFPAGVCDWSQKGVGEQKLTGTWQEFGPERKVDTRERKLGLRVRPGRPRAGKKVTLRATLRPCPQVKSQRIDFERKRKGRGWKPIAARLVGGKRCRVKLRQRVSSRDVAFRALAKRVEGYSPARSDRERVRPRPKR